MKIGFINNAYFPTQWGGSERSVQLLADSVVRQGHKGAVLTINPSGKYEEGVVNGINVTYIPTRNLYNARKISPNPLVRVLWHLLDSYNPLAGAEVTRWLKKEKPDLLHTNIIGGISVAAWDSARKLGIPVVHTLREYYLQCRLMSLNRGGRECNGICSFCKVCAVPRRARSSVPSAVVGITRHVLDSHVKGGFFPGVDIREVIFNPFIAKAGTSSSTTSTTRIRLGFIGRLETLKGIDFLLKEMRSVPKDKYELFVAGPETTPYVEEAKKIDYGFPIHYLGFSQPEEFFPKIDVLIVPSLWQEPFGRVIVEAYSHGIPLLASAVGGIPEIVDEGVTGFLFDPFTEGSFQQKLAMITPEVLQRMRPACLEKTREFEPDHIGRQYIEVYNRVFSQKHLAK